MTFWGKLRGLLFENKCLYCKTAMPNAKHGSTCSDRCSDLYDRMTTY